MAWTRLNRINTNGMVDAALLNTIKDNILESSCNTVENLGDLPYGSPTADSSVDKLTVLPAASSDADSYIQVGDVNAPIYANPYGIPYSTFLTNRAFLETKNDYELVLRGIGLQYLRAYAASCFGWVGGIITRYDRVTDRVNLGGSFTDTNILYRYYTPYSEVFSKLAGRFSSVIDFNASTKTWVLPVNRVYTIDVIKNTKFGATQETYDIVNGSPMFDVEPIPGYGQLTLSDVTVISGTALGIQGEDFRLYYSRYRDLSSLNAVFGGFVAVVRDANKGSATIPEQPGNVEVISSSSLSFTITWEYANLNSVSISGFELEYSLPYVEGDGREVVTVEVTGGNSRTHTVSNIATSLEVTVLSGCNLIYLCRVRMRAVSVNGVYSPWSTYRYISVE